LNVSTALLTPYTCGWEFATAFMSILLIDLVLAGDNAVVIAMAVRSLPRRQRFKGLIGGAAAAVVLRVIITFFAAKLLQIGYVKLLGGILILWIAVNLFTEGARDKEGRHKAENLWHAMRIIVVADVTMSLDNILAVAGASNGNPVLLIFGLGLSIPCVVFTSSLLSMLMDKYPVIVYLGAAILGKVGAEMIFTDPIITEVLQPSVEFQYVIEALSAVGVIVVGKLWVRWQKYV
jgi:YjbE family integral membrane protein